MVATYRNIHGSGIKYTIISTKLLCSRRLSFIYDVVRYFEIDELESVSTDRWILDENNNMQHAVFFKTPEMTLLFPYLIMEYDDMKKG